MCVCAPIPFVSNDHSFGGYSDGLCGAGDGGAKEERHSTVVGRVSTDHYQAYLNRMHF